MSAYRSLTLTEKQFQSQVEELADILGWRHYHTHDSRRSQAGFPDLTLVKPPRLIFAELKVGTREPTREQQAWIDDLLECGIEVYVWRPDDWQRIVEILQGVSVNDR